MIGIKKQEAKEMNATYLFFTVFDFETGECKTYKTFGRAYKAGNKMAFQGRNVSLHGIAADGQEKMLYCC